MSITAITGYIWSTVLCYVFNTVLDFNGGTGGGPGGGGGGPNLIGADTGGGGNPNNPNNPNNPSNSNNPCGSNPCMNKGVCLANRGSYDCLCSLQFTGPHCEG